MITSEHRIRYWKLLFVFIYVAFLISVGAVVRIADDRDNVVDTLDYCMDSLNDTTQFALSVSEDYRRCLMELNSTNMIRYDGDKVG